MNLKFNNYGWTEFKLADLIAHKKGFAFSSSDFQTSGIRIIRISDTTSNSVKEESQIYVSDKIAKTLNEYLLHEDDIVISTVGSRPPMFDSMVGKIVRIPKSANGSLLNQNMVKIFPIDNKKLHTDFLFNLLNENRYVYHITKIIRGNANQVSITLHELFSYKILLPPILEQKKISKILFTWDYVIQIYHKLIYQKKLQQKSLLQQLLSGKPRFPEFNSKWKKIKLDAVVKSVHRTIAKPDSRYRVLGIRSHFKGTFEKYIDDPTTVAMEELYIAKENDLIVNITFAWEGAVAIVPKEHDGGLVSHRFPMYRVIEEKIDLDFLRYVIIQPRFKYLLGVISPGGAGRNRVLSKKDFLELEILLPEIDEQRKIGQVLRAADNEIELLHQQLEVYKEQKKGLMQQLLTGKKRVKVKGVA